MAQIALVQMIRLPALAGHREELLSMIPEGFTEVFDLDSVPSDTERKTLVGVEQYPRREEQRSEDADEQAELLAAKEIYDKAVALKDQNRLEEALTAYDEVVRRFGDSETLTLLKLVCDSSCLQRGYTWCVESAGGSAGRLRRGGFSVWRQR